MRSEPKQVHPVLNTVLANQLRTDEYLADEREFMHNRGELDAIKAAAPALKYCHGKDFKEEHWSALLQGKLGLGKDVRLETLTAFLLHR